MYIQRGTHFYVNNCIKMFAMCDNTFKMYIYQLCTGIPSEENLEIFSNPDYKERLYRICQGQYERIMIVDLDLHKFCYKCANKEIGIVLRSRKTCADTGNDDARDHNASSVTVLEMIPIRILGACMMQMKIL